LLIAWYVFLLLGLLTFASLALISRPPLLLSSAVALPHRLLFTSASNLQRLIDNVSERQDYRATIAQLERQLSDLKQEHAQLQITLEQYRKAITIAETQSPSIVAVAPVIGIDASPLLAQLSLGAGRNSGIRKNMPVTLPEGLVGIVTDTTEYTAMVRTIADPISRIGVSVRGKAGQGIAVGEINGLVRVIDYRENEHDASHRVEVGDLVETSSLGGLFPKGILLGEVIEVFPKDPNQLRREFLLRPAVDLPTIDEVIILRAL
jgi:rod shape-determining protein MreC